MYWHPVDDRKWVGFVGFHTDDLVEYEQNTEISKEMLQVQMILRIFYDNIPEFEMRVSALFLCTFKKLFAWVQNSFFLTAHL